MLAKSKLNSIETLISQALIDMEISHEEFITILNEKDKYKEIKSNLINKNEKSHKIMRLSGLKCIFKKQLINISNENILFKVY